MGTGEQKGVQDFHDGAGFFNSTSRPLIEQVEEWQAARGQSFSQHNLEAALEAAQTAVDELDTLPQATSELRRYLLHVCVEQGFEVRFMAEADPVLDTKMRARIDIRHKVLEVFQPSLEELASRLVESMKPMALCLVLAHELFHAFRPRCPQSELAAHLFAGKVCGCPRFPGLFDL